MTQDIAKGTNLVSLNLSRNRMTRARYGVSDEDNEYCAWRNLQLGGQRMQKQQINNRLCDDITAAIRFAGLRLRSLDLSSCHVTDDDGGDLFRVLARLDQHTIEEIDLSHNQLAW